MGRVIISVLVKFTIILNYLLLPFIRKFVDSSQNFAGFVNSLPFVLNIVIKHKTPIFFVTCNDFLEKQVISLLWKKTYYGYAIFIILLTKSMRNTNTQLTHCFYCFFFKWQEIADWEVLRSSANSWVFLCRLYSTNSL